jgi:FkbM family methyltransferase
MITSPHSIKVSFISRLVDREDPLILEIGCNDGGDTAKLVTEFPYGTVYAFEPDERPLRRFCATSRVVHLHRVAIGAYDGWGTLHLSGGTSPYAPQLDWDLSSSLRAPTGHLVAFPWCTFTNDVKVEVRKLDSWCDEWIPGKEIDFIWADVQGCEGDLIEGGYRTLCERTKFLYTEFCHDPLYDGQIKLCDILERLPEFENVGIFENCNVLLRNRNKA